MRDGSLKRAAGTSRPTACIGWVVIQNRCVSTASAGCLDAASPGARRVPSLPTRQIKKPPCGSSRTKSFDERFRQLSPRSPSVDRDRAEDTGEHAARHDVLKGRAPRSIRAEPPRPSAGGSSSSGKSTAVAVGADCLLIDRAGERHGRPGSDGGDHGGVTGKPDGGDDQRSGNILTPRGRGTGLEAGDDHRPDSRPRLERWGPVGGRSGRPRRRPRACRAGAFQCDRREARGSREFDASIEPVIHQARPANRRATSSSETIRCGARFDMTGSVGQRRQGCRDRNRGSAFTRGWGAVRTESTRRYRGPKRGGKRNRPSRTRFLFTFSSERFANAKHTTCAETPRPRGVD